MCKLHRKTQFRFRCHRIACSKDPGLSQIVETHLYHHVIVNICFAWTQEYAFRPDDLSKRTSHPNLLASVINSKTRETSLALRCWTILPKLYFRLPNHFRTNVLYWSGVFRAVLEDHRSIPTIKKIHFVGQNFPLSLVDNCKDTKTFHFREILTLKINSAIRLSVEDPDYP